MTTAATCVIAVQAAQRSLAQVTFQVDRVYTSGQFFNEYVRFLAARTAPANRPSRRRSPGTDLGLHGQAVDAPRGGPVGLMR
ncbi:hypothetical protein [Actinoplanes sp. ATCC 53533]|uniref:hypothetical protein n=1 Tax=Actinoplanes sp. ATCC 53533 TaxID=1288362 RepID=UPI000F775DEE|nr:hypothetical protein [Actinoplanes sp. ATCC 53533]